MFSITPSIISFHFFPNYLFSFSHQHFSSTTQPLLYLTWRHPDSDVTCHPCTQPLSNSGNKAWWEIVSSGVQVPSSYHAQLLKMNTSQPTFPEVHRRPWVLCVNDVWHSLSTVTSHHTHPLATVTVSVVSTQPCPHWESPSLAVL